jgi:hypothetical protein
MMPALPRSKQTGAQGGSTVRRSPRFQACRLGRAHGGGARGGQRRAALVRALALR